MFEDVTDEILARIADGDGSVNAARSAVDDFRTLLVRPPSARFPISRIAGLVGELIFLDRLLDKSPRAWRCWRGPTGDRHDFRHGNSSLEVKTSLRAGNNLIVVHGLEQMEPPAGGYLYMVHFVLEAVAGGMFTVSALGHSVLKNPITPYELKSYYRLLTV